MSADNNLTVGRIEKLNSGAAGAGKSYAHLKIVTNEMQRLEEELKRHREAVDILTNHMQSLIDFTVDRAKIFWEEPERRKLLNDHDITEIFNGIHINLRTVLEKVSEALKKGESIIRGGK